MMASGMSSAMQLTDLDDFITPSQECIKPQITAQKVRGSIEFESSEPLKYEKATITMTDCLACSGCITTAESILVSQQSFSQLETVLENNKNGEDKLTVVLSISPQSIASISAKYKFDMKTGCGKITSFFKSIGVDYVLDINLARSFSISEASDEFIERFKNKGIDTKSIPMLASACPGWICYAEKTHGYILPNISTTRSPQQIMGSLVKNYWATKKDIQPNKIFHVTLMPCFDKKLEASREEFFIKQKNTREVDLVLTTIELEEHFNKMDVEIQSFTECPLDTEFSSNQTIMTHVGSNSGGYAHHVFMNAARKLFEVEVDQMNWKTIRNKDFQEITLDIKGSTVLRFGIANGFRNIQNLMQKMKRGRCNYDYVEVMACPSGCINGAAQVKPGEGMAGKEVLSTVQETYNTIKQVEGNQSLFLNIYEECLAMEDSTSKWLHTSYKEVEKLINPLVIKW